MDASMFSVSILPPTSFPSFTVSTVDVVSDSSSSSPRDKHFPQRTNTITITSIPKVFFQPPVLNVLRAHFENFGEINQWVPLPGFGRIIVVYYIEENAEAAKVQCDPIVLEGEVYGQSPVTLRIYRADPNPLIEPNAFSPVPAANYLRPPVQDKNFLISPPGSPPVGWEPVQEEPPNACPLADDLIAALEKLQTKERRSSLEILLDPTEGSGVGVYVEDCDGDEADRDIPEEDWIYGETAPARNRWRPFATSMPPIALSA